MTSPRIFGDFNNMDRLGRVRLNVAGSQEGLARLTDSLSLRPAVVVHDDDLEADAVIEWSETERIWTARPVSNIRDVS